MKKIFLLIVVFIILFLIFFFIYYFHNDKTLYYSFDNEVNYVSFSSENIILKLNEDYDLKNKKIVDIIKNKEIIRTSNNLITGIELGTCILKVKDKNVIKRLNIKVIPRQKVVEFKSSFIPIFGPIQNNNYSMQNFEIENDNTFISFVNSSYIKTNSINDCKNNKKVLDKINKVYIRKYKNNKLKGTMIINDSGHAQSFLVDNNYVWTTSHGYGYLDLENRCWGKGKELMKIKWEDKEVFSKDADLKIKFYNNKGNVYKNPVVSFDKENLLASINVGKVVIVWDLNRFKSRNLDKKIYQFKLEDNIEKVLSEKKLYKQGYVIYGGYCYILYGAANENAYIVVYDMYGQIKKTVKYNLRGLGFEAEGIKIYNNKLYIGITKGNKKSYIYEIR